MVSGCGGVCATWKSRGDDVNDRMGDQHSAPCFQILADPAQHLPLMHENMAAPYSYFSLDDDDDEVTVVEKVCVKMKIAEAQRCLTSAL